MSEAQKSVLARLVRERESEKVPHVSIEAGDFLWSEVKRVKPKRILEIGTAHAYSTLRMIESDASIEIISLEHSLPAYERAVENIREAGYSHEITVIHTDAIAWLSAHQSEHFDMVFIDAAKKQTLQYFLLTRAMSPRLTLVDDVVKFREKMEDFYAYLESRNISHRIEMTDPDDGMMVIE